MVASGCAMMQTASMIKGWDTQGVDASTLTPLPAQWRKAFVMIDGIPVLVRQPHRRIDCTEVKRI